MKDGNEKLQDFTTPKIVSIELFKKEKTESSLQQVYIFRQNNKDSSHKVQQS